MTGGAAPRALGAPGGPEKRQRRKHTPNVPALHIDAEGCLLGGCLIDPGAFPRIAAIVSVPDFERREHRLIYAAIAALHERGQAVDLLTVSDALRKSGELEAAGDVSYIGTLANETPSAANVLTYAEMVRDAARHRRLAEASADFLQDKAGALGAIERALADLRSERPRSGFDPVTLTVDLLRAARPPRAFALVPHIPKGRVTELSGGHGISKSTAALMLLLSGICGYEWGGFKTNITRGVFGSREDTVEDILDRISPWLADMDSEARAHCERSIAEHLTLLGSRELKLKLTGMQHGHTVINQDAVDLVVERCKGADLIVLETASRLHGGDESNESLGVFADALEQIAERTGAAVLIIRHVSKSAARDKVTDSYAGRGGGALSDNVRSVLIMTSLDEAEAAEAGITLGEGEAAIQLTHAKSSYSALAPPMYFIRRPGPVLVRAMTQDRGSAEDDRMLAYLREQAAKDEAPSSRQVSRDSVWHGVSSRRTEAVLKRLRDAKRVRIEKVKRRGGSFNVWVPVESVTPDTRCHT